MRKEKARSMQLTSCCTALCSFHGQETTCSEPSLNLTFILMRDESLESVTQMSDELWRSTIHSRVEPGLTVLNLHCVSHVCDLCQGLSVGMDCLLLTLPCHRGFLSPVLSSGPGYTDTSQAHCSPFSWSYPSSLAAMFQPHLTSQSVFPSISLVFSSLPISYYSISPLCLNLPRAVTL